MRTEEHYARSVAVHQAPPPTLKRLGEGLNEPVRSYLPLIWSIARRAAAGIPSRGNLGFEEDILQELLILTPQLIERYDPQRGVTVGAYLKTCLSRHAWRAVVSGERQWRDLASEFSEEKTVSVDDSRGRQTCGSKKITLRAVNVPEDRFREAMPNLAGNERRLFELRYQDGLKQAEIAEVIRSTRLRVCRDLDKLGQRIKSILNKPPAVRTIYQVEDRPGSGEAWRVPKFQPWMRKYFLTVQIEITPSHPEYRHLAELERSLTADASRAQA